MTLDPNVPGKHKQVYTINTASFLEFEKVKAALVALDGVEDVLYEDQLSPPEITLLTEGSTPDDEVRQVVAQLGYQIQAKHFRIS